MDIAPARKEALEQFAGAHPLVIVKIHPLNSGEKLAYHGLGHAEALLQKMNEVILAEGSGQGELGIVKDDVL